MKKTVNLTSGKSTESTYAIRKEQIRGKEMVAHGQPKDSKKLYFGDKRLRLEVRKEDAAAREEKQNLPAGYEKLPLTQQFAMRKHFCDDDMNIIYEMYQSGIENGNEKEVEEAKTLLYYMLINFCYYYYHEHLYSLAAQAVLGSHSQPSVHLDIAKEMANAGINACIMALPKYTPKTGWMYLTFFIPYIHAAMLRYLGENYFPVNQYRRSAKDNKTNEAYVNGVLGTVSLDSFETEDKNDAFADQVSDVIESFEESAVHDSLVSAILSLPEDQQFVIKSLYGIETEQMTFREIAEKLNISVDRVNSIKKSAMKKLQKNEDAISARNIYADED